jgi:two-component system chemotaxis response regulator CheY
MLPNHSSLIVDGHQQTAEVIRDCLRELGLTDIRLVFDSERALVRTAEDSYELVIVDDDAAPAGDGLALIRALRRTPKGAAARYILVSSKSDSESILSARRQRLNGFILKPYSLAQLKRVLNRSLGAAS